MSSPTLVRSQYKKFFSIFSLIYCNREYRGFTVFRPGSLIPELWHSCCTGLRRDSYRLQSCLQTTPYLSELTEYYGSWYVNPPVRVTREHLSKTFMLSTTITQLLLDVKGLIKILKIELGRITKRKRTFVNVT